LLEWLVGPCFSSGQTAFLRIQAMSYLVIFASGGLFLAMVVFLWRRWGPGSGRDFGNKLAKFNHIPRNTFWYLLVNGVEDSALDLLTGLKKSTPDWQQASIELAPTLQIGLERLEKRFGPQGIYEEVKPIIARLLAASENTVDHGPTIQQSGPQG
jgi:hypothetical protein